MINMLYANRNLFYVIIVFFIVDFILGFSNAWATKNIKSSKMRASIPKLLSYATAYVIGCGADYVFKIHNSYATILLSIFVISIEFVSWCENFNLITGKKIPTEIINIFKKGGRGE